MCVHKDGGSNRKGIAEAERGRISQHLPPMTLQERVTVYHATPGLTRPWVRPPPQLCIWGDALGRVGAVSHAAATSFTQVALVNAILK